MKNLIIRLCRLLLPFFGASAVGCDTVYYPADEYGTPYADFEVKGRVQDAVLSQPVQGIQVSALYSLTDPEPVVTAVTDAEGRFDLTGSFFPAESILIEVKDVDGEENGGVFVSTTITVPLERVTDGGGWYSGKYFSDDVLVTMSPDTGSDW